MHYFVTGATGFIGKRLVKKPARAQAARSCTSCCARKARARWPTLREYWGVDRATRAVPVFGDLTAKKLGVSADDVKKLKGQVDHFYHLAAVYDLSADAESQIAVNIDGTRNVGRVRQGDRRRPPPPRVARSPPPACTKACSARTCSRRPRASTIPYFMTKHESEKIVRKESQGAVDGVPPGASWSATARPARWTRSTGRTTSSS